MEPNHTTPRKPGPFLNHSIRSAVHTPQHTTLQLPSAETHTEPDIDHLGSVAKFSNPCGGGGGGGNYPAPPPPFYYRVPTYRPTENGGHRKEAMTLPSSHRRSMTSSTIDQMLQRAVKMRVNMLLVLPPNILKNSNRLFLK